MKKPLISVIIPVHNGEDFLAQAIQSVLDQTYPEVEIWVVDNGSKDQTAKIAQSFPQVHYLYSAIANGAAARNEGIARSRGPLVAFLDHDDIWKPEKLSKQAAYLESNPSVDAVICHQQMFLEPGHKKPGWVRQEFFESTQPAYLPSVLLVKRTVLEQTKGFDPDFSLSSDAVWFFKAKHSGIEVACLPDVLFLRRVHGDNVSQRHCNQLQKELLVTIRASLQERRTKISVIIPVWNGAKYLAEAIETALNQDYPNKEILVVDDGSTDATQSVINCFGSRIRSVAQPHLGIGAARNTGVRNATGSYIAFLDSDDLWDRSKLSLQMASMDRSDPLIFTHMKQFVCSSLTLGERSKIKVDEAIVPGLFASNLLVSKQRFLQIGFSPENNEAGEFLDWYARALALNVPVVTLPELLYYRRVHLRNTSRQKEQYDQVGFLKALKKHLERTRVHAAP